MTTTSRCWLLEIYSHESILHPQVGVFSLLKLKILRKDHFCEGWQLTWIMMLFFCFSIYFSVNKELWLSQGEKHGM